VVSTNPSNIHRDAGDSRLLAITFSYSRVSDYNPLKLYPIFWD